MLARRPRPIIRKEGPPECGQAVQQMPAPHSAVRLFRLPRAGRRADLRFPTALKDAGAGAAAAAGE